MFLLGLALISWEISGSCKQFSTVPLHELARQLNTDTCVELRLCKKEIAICRFKHNTSVTYNKIEEYPVWMERMTAQYRPLPIRRPLKDQVPVESSAKSGAVLLAIIGRFPGGTPVKKKSTGIA